MRITNLKSQLNCLVSYSYFFNFIKVQQIAKRTGLTLCPCDLSMAPMPLAECTRYFSPEDSSNMSMLFSCNDSSTHTVFKEDFI